MIDIIKEKFPLKKTALILTQVFIFYRMVLNLIYSTEQPYETPKDFYFLVASLWFTVLIFVLRKDSLLKKTVWIPLLAGIVVLVAYYLLNNISVAQFGKVYFCVILFSWIICIASFALLADSLISGNLRTILIGNLKHFAIFFAMVIIMVVYDKTSIIPVVCPIVVFLFTDIEKNEWLDITKYFATGYYIAFAQTMTKSLIQNPDRYQDGRYLGSFMELESGGMFCGGAVVCILYFIALFIFSERKKWYKLLIPMILMIYPIYAVLRITSRSTQISLLFVALAFFIICHTRGKRETLKRAVLSLGICVVMVCSLLAYSSRLNERFKSGEQTKFSYWGGHILQLTAEEGRKGYFGEGSYLNAIDRLSSGRLAHWVESSKQIRFLGHKFEPFYFEGNEIITESPHNFYVLWLIEYGIIGGALAIIWMFYIGVAAGRNIVNRGDQTLMTFLWFVFCAGAFMFTCVRWKSPLSFSLLILQCGLLVKRND